MKRLAIGLLIIILLGMFAYCLPTLAQPSQIPHVNPAIARDSTEAAELLLAYGNLFNLAALRQYQDAHDMLQRLKAAEIPQELQYVIDRYNSLSSELFTKLNRVEFLLNEASAFFSENRTSDAQEKLNEAEAAIRTTRFLLTDIKTVTESLAGKLGVRDASATGRLKGAYNRLQHSLQLLRKLTDELNKLRQRLIENPGMTIDTRFYHVTLLEISAPATVQPGLSFIVSGQLRSSGGNIDRIITVLLDDIELARQTAAESFRIPITTPPDTPTGKHTLTVTATRQDHYSAAAKSLTIKVSKLPIQTEIQLPKLAVMPQPVQVSGRVHHELLPLQDARVKLSFRDSASETRTATDGGFRLTVKPPQLTIATATSGNPFYATTTARVLPLGLSLFGWQAIGITIDPAEPWYSSLQTERYIFTINPLNTALMLAALTSLGLVFYRRGRTRPQARDTCQPQPAKLAAITPPPRPRRSSIKGRILSSYHSGLALVEKTSAVTMLPHATLREFLKATTPHLASATQPFTELTILAETALYSPHRLGEETASRAEQLAASVREELADATA